MSELGDNVTESTEQLESFTGHEDNVQRSVGSHPPSTRGSSSSLHSVRSSSTKIGHEEPLIPDLSALDNPAADWRNMRRIIAEDPSWSLATVPLLTELNIKHIVKNFADNSLVLNDLLPKYRSQVLSSLSTSLPLRITASLVEDEGYWERCCKSRWKLCDVSVYGGGWKRMFFERNLQQLIENFIPETTDVADLKEIILLSAGFVKKLTIGQLLPPVKETSKILDMENLSDTGSDAGEESDCDHFTFALVLEGLPLLEELDLTYGVHDCGMNFEWNLFNFTVRDCLQLSQSVAACKTLKTFKLRRSKVDDDKVRVLISRILDHPGLIELDLSNNLIGDRGSRAVGKLLNNHCHLVDLRLVDNRIRTVGAQAIAYALTKNTILRCLNLRLNLIGDEGGQAICRALMKNSALSDINLGSNDLSEATASIISLLMRENSTLKCFDLSCNRLGPDGGKQLQEGIEGNTTIFTMDLRLTECGQESQYCIQKILHRNRESARQVIVKEMEANAPPQKRDALPQAAHRMMEVTS